MPSTAARMRHSPNRWRNPFLPVDRDGQVPINALTGQVPPDSSTTNLDCVSNGTYIAEQVVQSDASRFWTQILGSKETTMLGYGLIGSLVVIALVIWIIRAL